MAAWTSRIDAVADDGAGHVQVTVSYWLATDTTFTSRLGGATFSVAAGLTLADVQALIVGQGQSIRFGQNASSALQVRVGTTVAVP